MSDILFLSVNEYAGKIGSDEGPLTGIDDSVTLTVNAENDIYLARSAVTMYASTTASAFETIIVLKMNNTISKLQNMHSLVKTVLWYMNSRILVKKSQQDG